jgi:hypothetical protein
VKFPGVTPPYRQLVIEHWNTTDGTPLPTPRFTHASGSAAADARPLTPGHLLLLHHLLAHHLVHCRLDKAGADPFALAVALTLMGDNTPVVLDVGAELLHRTLHQDRAAHR